MKERWTYVIEVFPKPYEHGVPRPMKAYTVRPGHKIRRETALGRALLLIHSEMQTMYDVQMTESAAERSTVLIATGRRGGYPEQPVSMMVTIRPSGKDETHD